MISSLMRGRVFRLLSYSVIAQVVVSAAHFIVGLSLIRYAGETSYGHFVLAQSAVLLATTVSSSWISGPLATLGPKLSESRRWTMCSTLVRDHRRGLAWFGVTASTGILVAGLFNWIPRNLLALCVATAIAMTFMAHRELLKTVMMVYSRSKIALVSDCFYALVLLALTGVAILTAFQPELLTQVGVVAGGVAACLIFYRFLRPDMGGTKVPGVDAPTSVASVSAWATIRPLAVWSTTGATIYWLTGQGYNSLLAIRLDVAAVAAVAATRLLVVPAFMLAQGILGQLVPIASNWLVTLGPKKLLRRLLIVIGAIAMLEVIYLSILWVARDLVFAEVLRAEFDRRDVMLLFWFGVALVGMSRDVLQAGLLALERFRAMAMLSACCAFVSLSIMWFAIGHYGPLGAVIGLLAGETCSLIGTSLLLRRGIRDYVGGTCHPAALPV